MGVRLKTFLLLTVVVIISIITYVLWYANAEQRRMQEELHSLAQNYSYAYHAELRSVQERLLQLALFAANDDHVQELMAAASAAVKDEGGGAGGTRAAAIREKLYQHLHSSVNQVAAEFDIVTLHFHLTPGALSFLRFHNPEEMGDRLDDVRPMIVAAGREQKPFTGFEIGRYFAGVRAAAPVFAPANKTETRQCVGVVEFGIPVDNMLESLRSNRPWLNAAAFVYDAAIKQNMVTEKYATATVSDSIIIADGSRLQLQASTSNKIDDLLQLPALKEGLSGSEHFHFTFADKSCNATVLQLKDYEAQQNWKNPAVGKVIVWQDISARIDDYKDTVASLVWYGVFLFFALEGCIYLGLYLVSSKLKKELEHQRSLERVSGKAIEAAGSLGQVEQQPQLQLSRILQDQLEDAVGHLGAEFGMFVGAPHSDGELRILALSDMVWSTVQSAGRYERARIQLMQQGYIPVKMERNILVETMESGTLQVLEHLECNRDVIPFLPEGHPPVRNGILVPVRGADVVLGLLVLANRSHGFGTNEQIIAKAYADAAALLMHSDLREVERLSALETARVKEELFRNLNHELRTPLNVINGMSEELAQTRLDTIQSHSLKRITEAARRLTRIMQEVLFLAGLDAEDNGSIKTAPFRPSSLLTSIVAEFESKARERGIVLCASCDDGLTARFNGDSEKITLILRQLVGNAIKFSRDTEVHLSIRDVTESPASGSGRGEPCTLRFAVTDHGIGIPPEQQELIFEPFYQCDSSRVREFEGAGLGLSVARKVAVILRSEIKLESEVGVGSTFYFDLDLAPSLAEHVNDMRAADKETVAEYEPKRQQREHGEEAQLLKLLKELEEPLIHSRPSPCNVIASKLEAKRWPAPFASEVDKLTSFMDKYRYPEALDILHRLQIQLEYLETDTEKDRPKG